MNTADSIVAAVYIHQIIECFFFIFCNIWNSFLSFSHLIIHPIHGWSWFYWQFQFCFIVSKDKLPSWTVSSWEKPGRISRIALQEVSSGRPDRSYISISVFHSWEDQVRSSSHFWIACWREAFHKLLMVMVVGSFELVCADIRSSRSLLFLSNWTPGILTSITSLPRLTEVEDDTCDGVLAIRFIIGREFAVTRSSPEFCWDRFAIVSEHAVELKWLILNKHNKWFHSSRVKFPLVRMSASWFLVSMYLIWILGSRLIRSNNQSSASLWVLETCLIAGLLPLMIILITASLSSNTYNKASWCEDWTFEGTQTILFSTLIFPWDFWLLSVITSRPVLSVVWVMFHQTETIRSHNSRAGSPSNLNPASKDMISDSVELCETRVCFSHIQLIGTNVWLPKTHNVPPEVDFESSRSPAKSESSIQASVTCFSPFRDGSCKFVHWP